MGGCCASRDKSGDLLGGGHTVLPSEKRLQFNNELRKAVDKDYLHNEVLAHQQVLDFESYKSVMGLVSAYVSELTVLKNQSTFTQRMALLKKIQSDKLTPESQEGKDYQKFIVDLEEYQQKLQSELIEQVQKTLDLVGDDSVLRNSHETYEQRQQLFDHMNEVVVEKQDKLLQKNKPAKGGKQLDKAEEDKVYEHYSTEIRKMHEVI